MFRRSATGSDFFERTFRLIQTKNSIDGCFEFQIAKDLGFRTLSLTSEGPSILMEILGLKVLRISMHSSFNKVPFVITWNVL